MYMLSYKVIELLIFLFGQLWYFCVNGVFVYPVFPMFSVGLNINYTVIF